MAEIKVFCLHCGQHIQCDDGYRGVQINCPSCNQSFLIPQVQQAAPPAAAPTLQIRRQRPDYVNEAKVWEADGVDTPSLMKSNEIPDQLNPAAVGCIALGVICYAFGVVDFAGMPFHYDITGVSWSPIVAGVIGWALVGAGYSLNKGREPIPKSVSTFALILVGLVTAGAVYYFSSSAGSRLLTSTTSLESQVRESIEKKFGQDPDTSSIKIQSIHLMHESGNKYNGLIELRANDKTETKEVDVTYDGKTIMWKIPAQNAPANPSVDNSPQTTIDPNTGLPTTRFVDPTTGQHSLVDPNTGLPLSTTEQPASAPALTDWNKQETDAAKNGNIPFAVQTVLANPALRSQARNQSPQTVAKTPWNYYGQVVKLSGQVGVVQDFPAGSDFGQLLGGRDGADIVVASQDGTIVEMFCMKPSGRIKVGDYVSLYGYPVGVTEVENRLGGKDTHLMLVGNDYDVR